MTLKIELREEADLAGLDTNIATIAQKALNAAAQLKKISGEVSILITDNAAMQTLNAQWRGKDRPTDVLSFPAAEIDRPFLGDIAIATGVLSADARRLDRSNTAHLSHLLIHGFLHLLGHDHENDTDAEEMEQLEREALAMLGICDPYKS